MRTVGRYEVLRELGRGGMATVHLARQPELDRLIALKEMTLIHADRDALVKRFVRESRLAGSLSHPSIVTVFDFFEHEGTPYIAMEHVAGGSLRPYLGTLTDAQRLFVLTSMLEGLIHAEEHGVVHRDLKPENVLVSASGRLKITDFGVAKATKTYSTALTGVGMTVGTPGYMAPEQAMAQPIGPWTDLYAVGCMAYELFVGAVPFADSVSPMAMLMRHVAEPIPPAGHANPEVRPEISDWIAGLTAADPAQRTQTAQHAQDALEEIALTLHGPRWEREARLAGAPPPPPPSAPLPPVMSSLAFETYVPREPARPPADPPAPEPAADPPAEHGTRVEHAAIAPDASLPGRSHYRGRPPQDLPTQAPRRGPERPVAPTPKASTPPIAIAAVVIVAIVIVAVLVLV